MYKTFWSVKYALPGAPRLMVAWFDKKADAVRFSEEMEYSDSPIYHRYKDPLKIQEAENIISIQQFFNNPEV